MNPNRVRPLSNPCATFHSEWTASAVPSNNREEKRRRTAEGCCYYTAESQFFTLGGAERKSCVAGAGGTTERALLCERWIGRGGRRVYLCCWTVTQCSKMKERSGRSWVRSLQYQSLSLSVISWRWHCSKQQTSGWPREVFHHRDGFVQCFY